MSISESILSKDSALKQTEQIPQTSDPKVSDASKSLDDISGYKLGVESNPEDEVEEEKTAIKTLDQLTPQELVNLSPSELQTALPTGWNYAAHGSFIHIRDANGTYRIRIDPPDRVTTYRHMHIMNAQGKPLNINGELVSVKSPDGHIAYNK